MARPLQLIYLHLTQSGFGDLPLVRWAGKMECAPSLKLWCREGTKNCAKTVYKSRNHVAIPNVRLPSGHQCHFFSFARLHGVVSEKCKDAIEAPISCCTAAGLFFFSAALSFLNCLWPHSPGSWHHRVRAIVLSIVSVRAAVFPLAIFSRLKAWILHDHFRVHLICTLCHVFFSIRKVKRQTL